MITTAFKGKTPDPLGEIQKDIEVWNKNIESEVKEVGKETAQKMKDTIGENKVRPDGPNNILEDSIYVEYFDNGWGVGDISLLNKAAPYWAAINWGSTHIVGKRLPLGKFEPGEPKPDQAYFREGRWNKGLEGFFAKISKPIPAMNYIEKTIFWVSSRLNQLKG